MTSRVLTLIAATAAFWVLTSMPARYFWDEKAPLFAGVATLMCLVPAVLTLIWASIVSKNDPRQAALTALASSGVRMFVVLLGALVFFLQVPPFRQETTFLFWVVGAYLFTLTVEVLLLVGSLRKTEGPGV